MEVQVEQMNRINKQFQGTELLGTGYLQEPVLDSHP